MALAVFVLGGAASGKSAVVRDRYVGTLDLYEEDDLRAHQPFDGFSAERWYDADREKLNIPMYTNMEGNEHSLQLFGKPGLGGPGGPKTPGQLAEYPKAVLDALQILIEDLGFSSVEQFAREVIMDLQESGPIHFGRGLTHELSKFIAAAKFEEQFEIGPEGGSLIWDATGNADRYAYQIERVLKRGYDVEIVYVTCPLPVALKRAAERERRIPFSEVRRTHVKAAKVADDLEIMAGTHLYSNRMSFERVWTSSEGEEAQAIEAGYGESSI